MAVIRCPKGHYYDDQRFSGCPHCGISTAGAEGGGETPGLKKEKKRGIWNWLDREKTVSFPADSGRADSHDETEALCAVALEGLSGDDDQRTIGFFSGAKGNDYVTGWLVCVEGPEKGRDYRLHHGFNRIGRSFSMDVQVVDDSAVTRENHCSIVYDDRENQFLVIPSSGALTYCNGRFLTEPQKLNTGDEICLGNSRFEFIPFCREGRVWEKEDGK